MQPRREQDFARLVAQVQACRHCPAMEGRRRVLSAANGSPAATVMFIAEAPGRRGGEITGVPLTRDASGRRFTRLLALSGLERDTVFITNTVLCNPQRADGANRRPTTAEQSNCAGWLSAQMRLVNPPVVATLGATALKALARIESHRIQLREAVAQPQRWAGRLLVPLYHPSPRAGLSRAYDQQEEDFRRLGAIIRDHHPGRIRVAGRPCLPQQPPAATLVVPSCTNEGP